MAAAVGEDAEGGEGEEEMQLLGEEEEKEEVGCW